MDKFESNTKTVHLGLYLGLSSLFLLFLGVTFYDSGLDEPNDSPMPQDSYNQHRIYDEDEEDNVGSMLSNWLEGSEDEETYFTRILRGNEDGDVLYEDELVAAVSAIPSRAPVHFIVFPKKPVKTLSNAAQLAKSEILLGRLMLVAEKLARELDIASTGYRVVVNNGRDADQVIQHLHLHVMGGQSMGWPPWPVSKEDLIHKENVDVDYVDIPDDEEDDVHIDYDPEETHDDILLAQRIGYPTNLESTQAKLGLAEMVTIDAEMENRES